MLHYVSHIVSVHCASAFVFSTAVPHSSSPQQYPRSKDQGAAEDREEPCAGTAGGRKFIAGIIRND